MSVPHPGPPVVRKFNEEIDGADLPQIANGTAEIAPQDSSGSTGSPTEPVPASSQPTVLNHLPLNRI